MKKSFILTGVLEHNLTTSEIKLKRMINLNTGEVINFKLLFMQKKNRIIKYLIDFIRYALGWGYNSTMKWNDLPAPINENYEVLKTILQEWEEKGHIRIFEKDGERMIEIFSTPND
jgi:hypothetical protein